MKVCGSRKKHKSKKRNHDTMKLYLPKVQWIISRKSDGTMTNREIAETMKISIIWVKKLWARYKHTKPTDVVFPKKIGRPKKGLDGRKEHSAVVYAHYTSLDGGGIRQTVWRIITETLGMSIPYSSIRRIMRDEKLSVRQPNKSKQRKWVRFERKHSNSMWHTDYKVLPDGRYFISYEDDASRLITGYGVFEDETAQRAIDVLHKAIAKYGKPVSILTDHGSQFFSNEKAGMKRGEAQFEKELERLGIKHILARVGHPQTNGKLERFHGELQRKLHFFEQVAPGREPENYHVGGPFYTKDRTDPVERFIQWYNNERPHRSLDFENLETPAKAFVRKMAPDRETLEKEEESENRNKHNRRAKQK